MQSFIFLIIIAMNRFVFLLMIFTILSCTGTGQPQRDENGRVLKNGQFYDDQEKKSNEVWLCMGKTSHAYHSNSECYGIKSCGGEIKMVPLSEAIAMGRTPCRYCHKTNDIKKSTEPTSLMSTESVTDSDDRVYVCSSNSSTRYHAFRDCYGLDRCSKQVLTLSESEAEKRGYTPCKWCYDL